MELLPILAFLPVVIGIGFMIIVFIILRAFWLWYWKINNIVEILEGIDSKLLVLQRKLTDDTVVESNDSTA